MEIINDLKNIGPRKQIFAICIFVEKHIDLDILFPKLAGIKSKYYFFIGKHSEFYHDEFDFYLESKFKNPHIPITIFQGDQNIEDIASLFICGIEPENSDKFILFEDSEICTEFINCVNVIAYSD